MAGIDFSNNLNPYGPPPGVRALTLDPLGLLASYGAADARVLSHAVADSLSVSKETVSIGIGATQILFALPGLLQTKRSVVPKPTFWEYEAASARANVPIIEVPLSEATGFSLDADVLAKILLPGDALYIPNISNPTSRLVSKQDLLKLVENCPDTHFVIDETYLMFHQEFANHTLSTEVETHKNLHVILSLSKFYTIPGARVGVLISNPDFIGLYDAKSFIPYSLSPLSSLAAIEALSDRSFAVDSRARMCIEQKRIVLALHDRFADVLSIIPPDGNFVLARMLGEHSDAEVAQRLATIGITIRKGSILPGLTHEWIRFCIRLPEENDVLIAELEQALA